MGKARDALERARAKFPGEFGYRISAAGVEILSLRVSLKSGHANAEQFDAAFAPLAPLLDKEQMGPGFYQTLAEIHALRAAWLLGHNQTKKAAQDIEKGLAMADKALASRGIAPVASLNDEGKVMLNVTISRMSLLCALAPLGMACVAESPIHETPGESLLFGAAAEPLGIAPAELGTNGSAPADEYVFPREANPFGESYEQWAAKWWQWLIAIPASVNPNLNGPCDVNQSGHVFFLGGNYGGSVTRPCAVPNGQAIFFPILNAYAISCPELGSCETEASEDYNHEFTASLIDDFDHTLSLEIDGVVLTDLEKYRAHTATFSVPAPEDAEDALNPICSGPIRESECGVPVGSPRDAASDGYWVMLRPLSPGEHQIRFSGSVPSFQFSLDITYNLTVAN